MYMTPPPPHTRKFFKTISWIIHREIALSGKITKIWIISKLEDEENFKYVTNICMHRGIMHIGLVILASTV